MSAVVGQKASRIEGGLVSQEFIDSHASEASLDKGAQQFFTPPEAAKLIHTVIDPANNLAVIDLTAGDGALLAPFKDGSRYGVEIDPDQIKSAKEQGREYHAIQGNLVDVFPLLYRVAPPLDAITINPPFGLNWVEDTIRKSGTCNSMVATFVYATRLLSQHGQLAIIAGRDRLYKEVLGREEARGVYAVINCEDLYDGHGAALPCAIAFAVHPSLRADGKEGTPEQFLVRDCPKEMLDLCAQRVADAKSAAVGRNYYRIATYTEYHARAQLAEAWRAIQTEHRRRVEKKESERPEFDVQLFDGGKRVQVEPSAYALMAVRKLRPDWAATLTRLNGMSLNYFVQNERDWHNLKSIADDGLISIAPDVAEAVSTVLLDKKRTLVPLYAIKPQQRLGWLEEQDTLKCIKSDPEKGFVAGERYALYTRTRPDERTETKFERNKKTGEPEERQYLVQFKVMEVRVGHFTFTDSGTEASKNIKWLINHFEMPDPGDVGTMFPEETERMRQIIRAIEADTLIPNAEKWDEKNGVPEHKRFKGLRTFQVEDLARLLVKGSGLLAHEQGLGKTLEAMVYAEACVRLGAKDQRLFIVPGDLIPQWKREAERFFGRQLHEIKPRRVAQKRKRGVRTEPLVDTVHAQLRRIRQNHKMGGTGWYITYFEALSVVHTRRSVPDDVIVLDTRKERKLKPGTGKYGRHPETGVYGYHPAEYVETEREITSRDVCPECFRAGRMTDRKTGWNGLTCRAELDDGSICGYAHFKVRVKPAGSIISTAFRKGVIVIDELTFVKGDTSARSEVVRGLRARYKLGMTGTPIKNYIPDAFWLLWWCLGNASQRFPYGYRNKPKFLNDFAVMESYYTGKGNRRSSPRARPEVTNLSQLWRLLASSTIRRRKEETGEPLVSRVFHTVTTPLGVYQQRYINKALQDFDKLFADKYPAHPVVAAGLHSMMAPMLGLQQKLDYGAILPEADPDLEWWGIKGVSNWTPSMLRVLETAMSLVKQGRKVLIGSPIVETSRFIADALNEKGVTATHVLDASGKTADKVSRAETIYDFQTNDVDVLCTGIQAIRLGHNLDAANAVILHGLPWDFESLDQFVARVHRLTSQKDVDIYVVVPRDTLTQKKWELLQKKGDAAAIALDGRLIEHQEEQVDESEVIREMMERGVKVSDDDIEEADIAEAWAQFPTLDEFVIPESFTKAQAEKQAELRAEAEAAANAEREKYRPFTDGMLDLLTMANIEIVKGVEAMFSSYKQFIAAKRAEALLTNEDAKALAWWMEHDPEAYAATDEMFPTDRARLARAAYQQATEEPQPEEPVTVTASDPHKAPVICEPESDVPLPFVEPEAESEVFDDEQAEDDEPEKEPEAEVETPATKVSDPGVAADPLKIAEAIRAMKELHELGALDDDEFAEAKANLIASLKPDTKNTKNKTSTRTEDAGSAPLTEQLALL